jgi:hypothetical protein
MATHQTPKRFRRPDIHGTDELMWLVNTQEDLLRLQAALKAHEKAEGTNRYYRDATKQMSALVKAMDAARQAMRDWAVYGG